MQSDEKPAKDNQYQFLQNGVVVGLFAGTMIGMILAMLLGVMNNADGPNWPEGAPPPWIQNATGWMQGSAAVASALIAAVTVLVVALTLRATRGMLTSAEDTLRVTQGIYRDQANTNAAELRPWVFVEEISVTDTGFDREIGSRVVSVAIRLKNFGKTPAMHCAIVCRHVEQRRPFKLYPRTDLSDANEIDTIGPGSVVTKILTGIRLSTDHPVCNVIQIKWRYQRIVDFESDEPPLKLSQTPMRHNELWYLRYHNGKVLAIPSIRGDFDPEYSRALGG